MRYAAERATDPQLLEIQALCDRLLSVVEAGQPYREEDMAFHAAIARASANPIFEQLLVILDQIIEKSKDSPFDWPGFGQSSFPLIGRLRCTAGSGPGPRGGRRRWTEC